MTSGTGQALVAALALLRAPRSARPGPGEQLPAGTLSLLRIVAGDAEALAQAVATSRETADTVREAAAFYIQQVMFDPEANAYRVLGTGRDADPAQLRENHRWLARWLHPDRNPNSWEALYLDRVNQAWQRLRTPDRRERYNLELADGSTTSPLNASTARPAFSPLRVDESRFARPSLRWLPNAILTGLGIFAVAMLAALYAVHRSEELAVSAAQGLEGPFEPAAQRIASPHSVRLAKGSAPPDPTLAVEPSPNPIAFPASMSSADRSAEQVSPPALARIGPTGSAQVQTTATLPAPRSVSQLALVPTSKVAARTGTVEVARSGPLQPVHDVAHAESVAHQSDAAADELEISPASPTQPPTVTAAWKMTQRDANRLMEEFSQAYSDGNLRSLRGMLAEDVRGPRGGIDAILADYKKVFSSSKTRNLSVQNISWFDSGGGFTIVASFETRIVDGQSRKIRRSHGDIRMDLRLEANKWRIYRLLHDERQG